MSLHKRQEDLRKQQLDNLLNISYRENDCSSINLVSLSPADTSDCWSSRTPPPRQVEYFNIDESPTVKTKRQLQPKPAATSRLRTPQSASATVSAPSSSRPEVSPSKNDNVIDTYASKYYIDRAVISEIFNAARAPILAELEISSDRVTADKVKLRALYQKKVADMETQLKMEISKSESQVRELKALLVAEKEKAKKAYRLNEELFNLKLRAKELEATNEVLKQKTSKSEKAMKDKDANLHEAMSVMETLDRRCRELTEENGRLLSISERQMSVIKNFETSARIRY